MKDNLTLLCEECLIHNWALPALIERSLGATESSCILKTNADLLVLLRQKVRGRVSPNPTGQLFPTWAMEIHLEKQEFEREGWPRVRGLSVIRNLKEAYSELGDDINHSLSHMCHFGLTKHNLTRRASLRHFCPKRRYECESWKTKGKPSVFSLFALDEKWHNQVENLPNPTARYAVTSGCCRQPIITIIIITSCSVSSTWQSSLKTGLNLLALSSSSLQLIFRLSTASLGESKARREQHCRREQFSKQQQIWMLTDSQICSGT